MLHFSFGLFKIGVAKDSRPSRQSAEQKSRPDRRATN